MEIARTLCRSLEMCQPRIRGIGRLRALLERLVTLPDGEVEITMVNGVKLLVSPRSEPIIDRSLYIYGAYEANLMWLLTRLLRPGDVFIDVGANIGHLSASAAKLVGTTGKVLAIEPLRSTFEVLKRNLQVNHLTNTATANVALGIGDDQLEMSIPDQIGRGGASLLGMTGASRRDMVTVTTFDSLLRVHGIDRCRMVKIDVEGFEPKVIAGGRDFFSRRAADIICMEYSVVGGDGLWDPLIAVEQLLSHGYLLFRSTMFKGSSLESRLVRSEKLDALPDHDNIYFVSPECLSTVAIADNMRAG
jgi:FkbM family methyltransferase